MVVALHSRRYGCLLGKDITRGGLRSLDAPVSARGVPVAGMALVMGKVAIDRPIEYYPDHGPIVVAQRDKIENHAVLFSGLRDGDFVFAVRQHIPWRKTAVNRASSLLYTCTAHPVLDFESRVGSLAEIEAAIRPLGLNHLFVERENSLGVREDLSKWSG